MERKWWTLLASCTAIFMLLLDVTIVNVALPSIERALGADFSDLQWVIDAYALTLAGVLLAAGSLADKVGRRLVFMLGLAIFTASSLACGLAGDPLFLQLSRAAQGVGGAMMFGTSLALIAQEFQGRERGTALGIWGATTALAVSTGPLVGGALVDALSWRWIFFVNVPIGLAGLAVAWLRLRESRDPAASGVDLRGVALLCPALFLLVYALIRGNEEGWGSALIIGCFAGFALLLVLFVVVERRAADPLLDLSLFRKPAFTGVTVAGFALSASIFSMFLYITLFFQNVLGYSPLQAGLRSLPVTMPILFVSPLSGRLTARVPVRLLLGTGLAFVTLGLLLIGSLSDSSGWTALLPGQILAGIGIGLATPALASTAVGVVRPQLSGMASGASNTARQLGLATGIAALGSIFQSKIESTLTPLVAGMPASSHVHELARAVASGGTGRALQAVPPADRDKVVHAAHHAFVTGFNTIAMVSVAVAAVGCVAGTPWCARETSSPGGPAAAPAEPAPAPAPPRARAGVGGADDVRLDHPRLDHRQPVMKRAHVGSHAAITFHLSLEVSRDVCCNQTASHNTAQTEQHPGRGCGQASPTRTSAAASDLLLVTLQHFRGNLDSLYLALSDVLASEREVILVDYPGGRVLGCVVWTDDRRRGQAHDRVHHHRARPRPVPTSRVPPWWLHRAGVSR